MSPIRIIVAELADSSRRAVRGALEEIGERAVVGANLPELELLLQANGADVVIIDARTPAMPLIERLFDENPALGILAVAENGRSARLFRQQTVFYDLDLLSAHALEQALTSHMAGTETAIRDPRWISSTYPEKS